MSPICPQKSSAMIKCLKIMAEGVGFEPTLGFPLSLISSQVPSTTQPPFLRLVKSRFFDLATCVFYTAVLYNFPERRSIHSYRITLAENASGEPGSPRSIRKLLCPNPRQGQADLEVPQNRPHQRRQVAPERTAGCNGGANLPHFFRGL